MKSHMSAKGYTGNEGHRHSAGEISFLRVPIFWLFLGPPAFRLQEARGAMASMQGNYDFWNLFQTGWWLFFGLFAVRELYIHRRHLASFLRQSGSLPVWVILWLIPMYLSCLVSPRPLFSLANVGLLTVLVVAALDLGVKFSAGRIGIRAVLKWILGVAVLYLPLIGGIYLIAPGMVEGDIGRGDIRIRGGQIGYAPLLSSVAMLVGFYFWRHVRKSTRWIFVGVIIMGFVLLLLGQTRAAYGGFFAGLILYIWQWNRLSFRALSLVTTVALFTTMLCTGIILADMSQDAGLALRSVGDRLTRGGESTLSTLNGRTRAWYLLWESAKDEPLGLGYSAGPRALLMHPSSAEWLYSDIWGNAHNSYFEVFGGSGYLGVIAFLALIVTVVLKVPGTHRKELIPLHALLAVVLLGGITESEMVLPFKQSAVLFWIIVGTAIGTKARSSVEKERKYAQAPARPYR